MGYAIVAGGARASAPVTGIKAGDLAVGSSVYLMENGVAVEYLVVNQGKPSGSSLYDDSCDGTWLLRKDIKELRQWHNSDVNNYENSTIHAYLNGDFFNLFGSVEQAVIKQVQIPYVNGTGGSAIASGRNGLSCMVFLLGVCETGFATGYKYPQDGGLLDFFSANIGDDSTRIAYKNGSPIIWWLRSAVTQSTQNAYIIAIKGGSGGYEATMQYGIRPALVLPSTAVFDEETLILKGVA